MSTVETYSRVWSLLPMQLLEARFVYSAALFWNICTVNFFSFSYLQLVSERAVAVGTCTVHLLRCS